MTNSLEQGKDMNKLTKGSNSPGQVAQSVRTHPVHQKVEASVQGQGTRLHCGSGPGQGADRRQPINVSMFLPPH